jgi:hypothetical protein
MTGDVSSNTLTPANGFSNGTGETMLGEASGQSAKLAGDRCAASRISWWGSESICIRAGGADPSLSVPKQTVRWGNGISMPSSAKRTATRPSVEFSPHVPLLDWPSLDATLDYQGRISEGVESENLEVVQDQAAELWVGAHLSTNIPQSVHHLIDVLLISDPELEDVEGEFLCQIAHRVDCAERNCVHRTGEVTQAHCSDRNRLHQPRPLADLDDVADSEGIFEQEEEPRNQVLYQLLGTEADR